MSISGGRARALGIKHVMVLWMCATTGCGELLCQQSWKERLKAACDDPESISIEEWSVDSMPYLLQAISEGGRRAIMAGHIGALIMRRDAASQSPDVVREWIDRAAATPLPADAGTWVGAMTLMAGADNPARLRECCIATVRHMARSRQELDRLRALWDWISGCLLVRHPVMDALVALELRGGDGADGASQVDAATVDWMLRAMKCGGLVEELEAVRMLENTGSQAFVLDVFLRKREAVNLSVDQWQWVVEKVAPRSAVAAQLCRELMEKNTESAVPALKKCVAEGKLDTACYALRVLLALRALSREEARVLIARNRGSQNQLSCLL